MPQTFGDCACKLIESKKAGWRNAKHRYQWRQTLLGEVPRNDGKLGKAKHDYCAGLRNAPVNEIATDDVLAVLRGVTPANVRLSPKRATMCHEQTLHVVIVTAIGPWGGRLKSCRLEYALRINWPGIS